MKNSYYNVGDHVIAEGKECIVTSPPRLRGMYPPYYRIVDAQTMEYMGVYSHRILSPVEEVREVTDNA